MTQDYYGTKRIAAIAMTRQEYNDYRGWSLPDNENGEDAGYLIEYRDGGPSNHPNHTGYISWSPKDVFDGSYQASNALSFGHAIVALKAGHRVARTGWNGKDMFLFLVPGSTFKVNRAPLLGIYPEGAEINYRPHIDIKGADGRVSTWAPSIGDALADDWQIVD